MSGDAVTVLITAGRDCDKLATKRIHRAAVGEWQIEEYGNAKWWSVREIQVHDLVSLGKALARLEHDPHSCGIRGEPIEGINLDCCRRLKDPDPEDGTPPSFAPTPRRWLGIDVDSLPTPIWNPESLARRREAIRRDYAERNRPEGCPEHLRPSPVWRVDDEDEHGRDVAEGIAADADPAPIDPATDWPLCIRAAVVTLPNRVP